MKKLHFLIILAALSSCQHTVSKVFGEQKINLSPVLSSDIASTIPQVKIEVVSKVKSDQKLGNRIAPNINGDYQGLVFVNNDPALSIKTAMEKFLKSRKTTSNKILELKLFYFTYMPAYSSMNPKIACDVGLKTNLKESSSHTFYSKWQFVHEEFEANEHHIKEVTEKNINDCLSKALNNVVSDKDLIAKL